MKVFHWIIVVVTYFKSKFRPKYNLNDVKTTYKCKLFSFFLTIKKTQQYYRFYYFFLRFTIDSKNKMFLF